MTGSGAYADLTVFGCRSGKVTEVFTNSYLYGTDIEEASADRLVLKVGKWALSDPHCCPSMEDARYTCGTSKLRSMCWTEIIPSRFQNRKEKR
jgi:hypothetical protein